MAPDMAWLPGLWLRVNAPPPDCSPRRGRPQILTGLTMDARVALLALTDILLEDITTECLLAKRLAFGIIAAGVWETGTWVGGGR